MQIRQLPARIQMETIRRTVLIIMEQLADMPADTQMGIIHRIARIGMEPVVMQMGIIRRTARIGMEPVVIQMETTRRTARIGAEARVIPEVEAARVMADTMTEDIMEGVTIDGDYEEVRRKCAVKQK